MTTLEYRSASRTLLAQARAELAAGDLRQASEKGWGAAAQMIKAVAQERGWPHDSHRALFRAVSRLRGETGDSNIAGLFGLAHNLHVNFYENWEEARYVVDSLDDVERFLELLEPLT